MLKTETGAVGIVLVQIRQFIEAVSSDGLSEQFFPNMENAFKKYLTENHKLVSQKSVCENEFQQWQA